MAGGTRKWPRILAITAGVLAVALGIIQYAMKERLHDMLLGSIPEAEAKLKVGIDLNDASVNMFGREANISGLSIQNPEGFEDDLMIRVGDFDASFKLMPFLFGRKAHFRTLDARELDVRLVRNAQSAVNINHLSQAIAGKDIIKIATVSEVMENMPVAVQQTLQKTPASEAPEPAASLEDEGESREQPTRIESLKMAGKVHYADHFIYPEMRTLGMPADEDVFELALDLTITGRDLTYYQDHSKWGKLNVSGHLAGDEEVFRIDLRSEIAPVQDPDHISMRMTGNIENIDLEVLKPYTERYGFNSDPIRIELNLVCKDGYYDPRESQVVYHVSRIRLSDEMAAEVAKKTGGLLAFPEKFELPVPVTGPYNSPELDMDGIDWASVILKNLPVGDLLGEGLKMLTEGVKEGGDSKGTEDALEGLLKGFLGSGGQ